MGQLSVSLVELGEAWLAVLKGIVILSKSIALAVGSTELGRAKHHSKFRF